MYTQQEINKWFTREKIGAEKFVITDKLDGNSGFSKIKTSYLFFHGEMRLEETFASYSIY